MLLQIKQLAQDKALEILWELLVEKKIGAICDFVAYLTRSPEKSPPSFSHPGQRYAASAPTHSVHGRRSGHSVALMPVIRFSL
jgi:hypothetical protein